VEKIPGVVLGPLDATREEEVRHQRIANLLQWKRAIQDLDQAMELGDTKPAYYVARGFVYLWIGDIERATKDFVKGISWRRW
jgi:hypothetical protein